jgi:tetratricopeptide (TPR) repeat protein
MNKENLIFFFIIIFFCLISFFILLPEKLKIKKNVEIYRYLNSEYSTLNGLVSEKKIDEAYRKAIYLYNKYPEQSGIICIFLADFYYAVNNLKDAEWFYRKAIEIDNRNVGFYVKLSYFYRINNKMNSSLLILNECAKFAQFNQLLLYEYGEYYYQMKDYLKALDYMQKVYDYNNNKQILIKIQDIYKLIDK